MLAAVPSDVPSQAAWALLCGELLLSDGGGQLRQDVQQRALHRHQRMVVQHADTQEVLWEQVRHNSWR